MSAVRLLELYPEHLNVNGDTGNVFVLAQRLSWAGVPVERLRYSPGDELPAEVDLVAAGSGPLAAQRALAADLAGIAPTLRAWAADGMPMLGVSGGFELLTRSITTPEGDVVEGAGVFDATVDLRVERRVSKCFIVDAPFGRLVGVENQGARTELGTGAQALGTVRLGLGNRDGAEGAVVGNAYGTHLHGPVLAANPILADRLASAAATRRGHDYALGAQHREIDAAAEEARRTLLQGTGFDLTA